MLSVCVPIFNHDIRDLLLRFIEESSHLLDIICIDDASSEEYRMINFDFCKNRGIQYIQLEENIGRSAIRNLFLKYSDKPYLLFLDCDSLPVYSYFLEEYVKNIEKFNPDVIYGGTRYKKEKPLIGKRLRWRYGHQKESKSFENRQKKSNQSFQTNNFVVKRVILEKYRFDERIRNYGHEDTLWGILLWKNKKEVLHIDNPVWHDDNTGDAEFVLKTEEAIDNLIELLKIGVITESDYEFFKLLSFVKKQRASTLFLLQIIAFLLVKPLAFFLKKSILSFPIFLNFYKLMYFLRKINNRHILS